MLLNCTEILQKFWKCRPKCSETFPKVHQKYTGALRKRATSKRVKTFSKVDHFG